MIPTVHVTETGAGTASNACVACGHATNDRYFANSTSPDFGTGPRRLRLPIALCRNCPPPPVGDEPSVQHRTPALANR